MLNCPVCKERLVEIVYGLASPELMDKANKKEVCLGGCCIIGGIELAKYHCFKCGKNFYKDLTIDDGQRKLSN